MEPYFDIVIVGGGPAGLTAAIYARRAGKSVLLLEKESFGGQIASAPKVENFPGLPAVSGAELADRLYGQAESLGARIELEEVLEIRDGTPKRVVTDYGAYAARGAFPVRMGWRGSPTARGATGPFTPDRTRPWPAAATPPFRTPCIWRTSAAM